MHIGVLGSGNVGQTLANALVAGGADVMVGTRDPEVTRQRPEWVDGHDGLSLGTYEEAASFGEAVILAVGGQVALEVLESVGAEALADKILLDLTNPLDFSEGFPPTLFISNTDSLGETIQRTFPDVRVVKTLNTVNAALMVAPRDLADGDHSLFVSGNDEAAKRQVIAWLGEWFGWQDVIDLGDITTARGTEQLLALWVRLLGTLGTPRFQFKIVR